MTVLILPSATANSTAVIKRPPRVAFALNTLCLLVHTHHTLQITHRDVIGGNVTYIIPPSSSVLDSHQRDLSHRFFSVTVIVTVRVMKTFELQLIFVNNCNRYLIQLLLLSKYLITEQNLAVYFLCQHVIVIT